jgi:hypothetical protein
MSHEMTGRCTKEACTAGEDGKCLEGFENLEECPNYETIPPEDEGEDRHEDAPEEVVAKTEMVDLPTGTDFSPQTSFVITRASQVRVLVLAGSAGSGKTTLLACIYDSFQKGPFADYLFCGSQTLMGFEERCHLSRIASGRQKADTERTKPTTELRFLHLKVRSADFNKPPQDLLLSDLSGEIFRLASDSTEECKKLGVVKRADRLILFIDGKKLSTVDLRQSAFVDSVSLLRSFLDSGMLGKSSLVDVLFSKWDLVKSSEDEVEVKRFVKYVLLEIKRRFGARLGGLRFHCVAARPENDILPFAFGVERIFPGWVEKVSERRHVSAYRSVASGGAREFDRFFHRQLRLGSVER